MATWTNETPSATPRTNQELLIEGAFRLLIGEGYFLKIQEADSGTSWTEPDKQADATFTNVTKN